MQEDRSEDGGGIVQVPGGILRVSVETTVDTDGRSSVVVTARLKIWSHLECE